MCAVAGFDFVLIDSEHGPADLVPLRQHLAITAGYEVPTLVRVGTAEPALVLRALERRRRRDRRPAHRHRGPGRSADRRRALTRRSGHRGFATYSRAGRYGQLDPSAHPAAA